MQELHKRKRNCRHVAKDTRRSEQCTQRQQRIRCCGRVVSEEEFTDSLLEKGFEQIPQAEQRQAIGQGRRRQNGQGNGKGQGRRRFQGQGQGQGQQV